MKNPMFDKADKIWRSIYKDVEEQKLELDLSAHKELLDIFHISKFYYYVFNLKRGAFDFVSAGFTDVMGYPIDECTVPFLLDRIHPEDQPWFLNFENKVVEFFSNLTYEQIPRYKVSYDYRIRAKSGEYVRVLQQVITKQTVDTHRKNLLQKSGTGNTAGLVSVSIEKGWI